MFAFVRRLRKWEDLNATFAEIGEPRRSVVLDQGGAGELALAKVLASDSFVSRRGLAVELSFAFFLFLKFADLTVFLLL